MADSLEIRVDIPAGLAQAEHQLDPKRVHEIFVRYFMEGPEMVKREMRAHAPALVRGRVKVKKDPMNPPHWALVGSTHPVAHIIEGGTAARGASGFHHSGRHFPPIDGANGLMATAEGGAGLSRARAWAMARTIAQQGGLSPKPFVAPTEAAVRGPVLALFRRIIDEVLR